MTRFFLSVLLMVLSFSIPADAFEVDGFRSGMSVEEAVAVAHHYSKNVKPFTPIPQTTWLVVRSDEAGKVSKEWEMLFCNNALVEVNRIYPFNWPALVEIVSRMNQRYGQGSVGTSKYKMETKGRSTVGIRVSWEDDIESVDLLMQQVNSKEPGPGKSAQERAQAREEERISEMYALRDDGCINNGQDKNSEASK